VDADVDRWGRLVRKTGIASLISVGLLFARESPVRSWL
jgi:hypothetical protein